MSLCLHDDLVARIKGLGSNIPDKREKQTALHLLVWIKQELYISERDYSSTKLAISLNILQPCVSTKVLFSSSFILLLSYILFFPYFTYFQNVFLGFVSDMEMEFIQIDMRYACIFHN